MTTSFSFVSDVIKLYNYFNGARTKKQFKKQASEGTLNKNGDGEKQQQIRRETMNTVTKGEG